MMRDQSAATFADDVRMGYFLLVADVADVLNDVGGVFLQRVVSGTVEIRTAAIVIHAATAADGGLHLAAPAAAAWRRLLQRRLLIAPLPSTA